MTEYEIYEHFAGQFCDGVAGLVPMKPAPQPFDWTAWARRDRRDCDDAALGRAIAAMRGEQ